MYHCLSHHRPSFLRPTLAAPSLPMQHSSHIVHDNITLNDTEKALLGTLLEATQAAGSNTVLRCAGGWVRDKLLGKSSLDIDVALDNMMGKDFAELVNRHLASQGKETRHAAVIQSNPDQSKHLETARMKINNLWIDLVNLRSETYAQDSRIPTVSSPPLAPGLVIDLDCLSNHLISHVPRCNLALPNRMPCAGTSP